MVPNEHPAPDEVRTRLDEVARTYLVEVCSRWLTQFLDPDDPSIWFIRQLNIDLSADIGSMDNSELAEIWGRQFALSIINAITTSIHAADGMTEAIGDTVRRYRNQAVYVAHFIADLAEGRAWSKWYYRPFDSLSSLSTSTAIRTVMMREPELIIETLLHLATQKRLEPVLRSLSEYDASIIYDQGILADTLAVVVGTSLSASASTSAPAVAVDHVADRDHRHDERGRAQAGPYTSSLLKLALSVWASAALELSSKRLATPHNALRLYAAMRERSATLDASHARHTIDSLLRLAEVLRSVSQPAKLVAHLLADELTEALELLRNTGMLSYIESLSFLQQIALGDATLIRRVVTTIATSVALVKFDAPQNQQHSDIHDATDTITHSFTTLLGSTFLLMPAFLDVKLYELVETAPYPTTEEEHVAPVLRYLLFLKCFGLLYTQWPDIAYDPALLLLAGLEETPSPSTLLHLSQSATREMNETCIQELLARLARYRYIEGRYLFAELVEVKNDYILLLRDMKNDAWVYASYLSAETRSTPAVWDILMRGLALLQKAVAREPEYLVFGSGFEKLADFAEFYSQYQASIQLVWTQPIPLLGALSHQHSSARGNEEDAITLCTRAQALPSEVQAMFVRYLRRMQPASKDLDYLTLNVHRQPLIENRDVDLTWSLVARALMRAFARRMMGFDQSSMPYLYQNFLAGTSTIHVQQDLIEVRLPCSPLHTVLRMAGVDGQSYALPWLNNTQITLELIC